MNCYRNTLSPWIPGSILIPDTVSPCHRVTASNLPLWTLDFLMPSLTTNPVHIIKCLQNTL